ncbi:MAG: tetratricopeptide repeat protein [Muribaculaceae bacterium]|nr:tetratricopeptide repeat protein [Muribaculaceae bacterium]
MKKLLSALFSLAVIGAVCAAVYFNQDFSMKQVNKVKGMYYVYKGDKAYRELEMQDAINLYNRGLKLYPGHYGAWYNLGNIYASYEDYYSSVYAYSQAFKYNPRMMIARMNYGIISSERLGDFDSALKQYDNVIKTKRHLLSIPYVYNNKISFKENRAIAYYNKGVTYRLKSIYANDNWEVQRKYLAKAIDAYKKSIEINPNSYDAQYNLGLAYHISGNYNQAGSAYCKAISLSPMNYEAHYNLAILLRKLGYYKEAYDEIDKASTLVTALDENSVIQQYAAIMMNDIMRSVYSNNDHKKKLAEILEDEKSNVKKHMAKKKDIKTKETKEDKQNDSITSVGINFVNGKVVATEELDVAMLENFGQCSALKYFQREDARY